MGKHLKYEGHYMRLQTSRYEIGTVKLSWLLSAIGYLKIPRVHH